MPRSSLADRAFAAIAQAHRSFKVKALAELYPNLTGSALNQALAREQRLDGRYLRNARARLNEGTRRIANQVRDPRDRRAALEALIANEQRFLGMHIEEASRRMAREQELHVLKEAGERGGVWMLGPRARHTPDCLAMAGKFWEWDVLDVINPANRHAGCGCWVASVAEARRRGVQVRRGYRTAAMRVAGDVREALLAPVDPERLLTEAQYALALQVFDEDLAEVMVGSYTRRSPSGKLVHVRRHDRSVPPGAREIYVTGEVRPSLERDVDRMVAAAGAGDRDEVDRLHDDLRRRAAKIANEEDRAQNLRVIDRVRAALENPEGHRPVAGRNRLAPYEEEGITEPWSDRETFAWLIEPGMFGKDTDSFVDALRKSPAFRVAKAQDGRVLIESKKTMKDPEARARARSLEIMAPALRRSRAIGPGEYLDDDTPLDIGDDEPTAPGQDKLDLKEYARVTWGQLGDAGELAIDEVADRLHELGVTSTADREWNTMGYQNTPIDWFVGEYACEVKTHAWRGQSAGVLKSGPAIDPKQRLAKEAEMKARSAVRRKNGEKPLKPALMHVYVDFDTDQVHVFMQRYGAKDKAFASRRMNTKAMRDLVDGNATPGQQWHQERGPGAGTAARATMYVGSFRLKFNPLRAGDTGVRLGGEDLQKRRTRPARRADQYEPGTQAIEPPEPVGTGSENTGARAAQAAEIEKRNKKIIAELRKVQSGRSDKTMTAIGREFGITQPQVSAIAKGAGITIGRGRRTDLPSTRRRLRKAA